MFPLLLAGVPYLIKTVSSLLGSIDNPAAKTAVDALSGVSAAIDSKDITPEQLQEMNSHAEQMAQIAADQQTAEQGENAQSYRAEVGSTDKFVRRMRPTWGYVMALTWMVQMFAVSYVIVFEPLLAVQLIGSISQLTGLWGIALAVLGIYTYGRTQEKKADMLSDPSLIKSVPQVLGSVVGSAWSSATSLISKP